MRLLSIRNAIAFLMLFPFFSCTKQTSISNEGADEISSPGRIRDSISLNITKVQYQLLMKYFKDIKKSDSLINLFRDSALNAGPDARSSLYRTDYDADLDPGASEEIYLLEDEDWSAADGIDVGPSDVQYYHRVTFPFAQRRNVLTLLIPVQYNISNLWMPSAFLLGNVSVFLTGPAIGTTEVPYTPYANVGGEEQAVIGRSYGDLLEKRTFTKTSTGRVLVRAGLNAGVGEIGAEIGEDETVTSVENNITSYNWDISFRLSFQSYGTPLRPKATTTGFCKYSGTPTN
ncbi:hypothetical protein [Filimonas effusa]|uniref:Uncharacterized protein n=1 Tax=Filimonas effusa TaxID=2508721 RepID=A0A4Q1D554_9BACT|nr:hypothetical protein [Filimonas effusa]RXK83605.1 hypothetical protein ESB13_16085 [Filimonas effusa]